VRRFFLHLYSWKYKSCNKEAAMEGPAADEKESGLATAFDQLPFMLHVLVMLVIIWTFSSLGMKSLLMLCFCTAYLFQVLQKFLPQSPC